MVDINNLEHVDCAICGSKDYRVFLKVEEYLSTNREEFYIVSCKNCGLLFTNPRLSQKAVNSFYEEKAQPWDINKNKIAKNLSLFIRRHSLLRRIWHCFTGEYLSQMLKKSKGRVLDLGCGFGDILEDLTNQGCQPYGVEINSKAAQVCLGKRLKVYCGTLKEANFENESFDTVILCHTLEHFAHPKTVLQEIHRILKSSGEVLIYCPNAGSYLATFFGKYWLQWSMPTHFYHFTEKTIKALAQAAGFKVKRIRTVTPNYFFLGSLNRWIEQRGKGIFLYLQKIGAFNNIFFQIGLVITTRFMDLFLSGKGECIRVELKKARLVLE